jgi:hypothetical protein
MVVGISAVGAGVAGATACTPAVATTATCTLTGTLTLHGGALSLYAPASLAWSGTLNGANQSVVDGTHTTFKVDDERGTGAGWDVTAKATKFTTGSHTLPTGAAWASGPKTLQFTGSSTTVASTTAPSAACTTSTTCTLPTETGISYPVGLTGTTATAKKIYNAKANTGMGSVTVGGTNPAAWWVSWAATTYAGTYTSTVTLAVATGP